MNAILHQYDVYPKVIPVHTETEMTICPIGEKRKFEGEYIVQFCVLAHGEGEWMLYENPVTAGEDGALHFTGNLPEEGEYFIRVFKDGSQLFKMSVYALEHDLANRIPLRGDLHLHTYRSDGKQDPATVCANYRKMGLDFLVITDHHRYYPSLEAIHAYRDADITLNILPGEEVHLPMTRVHIVNAGGLYSINGLLDSNAQFKECGDDLTKRSMYGEAPAMITEDEYKKQIEEILASEACSDCPERVDKQSYAVCCWAFDRIREAGGLGIFAHPFWISYQYNVAIPLTRYLLKKHPFDAFEVLGGENYFDQNGLQTAMYYEEYKEGRVHPIVGSTDSHDSTENNRNRAICSTIVFAPVNEREAILQSIRDKYSVAVDTISAEYRLVGEFRLQRYACFLMHNWYPLHDRLAAADGEIMREYCAAEADASELAVMKKKSEVMFRKYFKTI